MTEHVTISLEHEHVAQARREAELHGITLETYLSRLIQGNLPASAKAPESKTGVSAIFGIGASAEPTDIGRDKDQMLGHAVWQEQQRTTQSAK